MHCKELWQSLIELKSKGLDLTLRFIFNDCLTNVRHISPDFSILSSIEDNHLIRS